MGSGVPRGARPPSHVAYYVALVAILGLLLMLCCYFCYYFVKKVKELSEQETPTQTPSARPPPVPATYPVQPVVRDSATAMARLCRQLPAAAPPGGDAVFPAATSPAAQHTDTGTGTDALPVQPLPPVADKILVSAIPVITDSETLTSR